MILNTSRFHTSIGTMAVAGCVLQLASMTAQADSAKPVASAAYAPAAAVRAHGDVRRHVVVPYRDLNLSSPEGVSALTARVKRAAESVCDGTSSYVSAGRTQAERQCMSAAVADAMAQVDSQIVNTRVADQSEHKCEDATHADAVAQLHGATVHEDIVSR